MTRVIRDYGEEKFARSIARHIIKSRSSKPIETTSELTELIKNAIPAKVRATGGHPAKRTFQAIRIELNRELEVLENTLDDMIDLLNEDGHLSIITFHSLEDRIVKQKFKELATGCICPPDFPICVCGHKASVKLITKHPVEATKEELEINPRSAPAKLRVVEKL